MIRNNLDLEMQQPIAVLGAGELASHVYRNVRGEYAYNIFRLNDKLETTQVLAVNDLRDLVKLCQLLAFALCDDGWLTMQERAELLELNNRLDEITCDWSEAQHG